MKRKKSLTKNIEKELKKENHGLAKIEGDVEKLKDCVVDKTPTHFSIQDIVISLMGALFFGLTFIMKSNLINTVIMLDIVRVFLITAATFVLLIFGIYILSYKRVKDKDRRRPFQFIMKRLVTLYLVSILIPIFLIYLFGINEQLGTSYNIMKAVIVLSMPCALGTSISYLFSK